MSIQDWAALAEIVGSIAVVLTLIYLAMQIRESNRETRAATVQSTLNNEMDMIAVMVENAGTWNKVVTGIPLEEGEEMRRGMLLYNLLMTETESRYHQYEAGYLDQEAWEQRLPAIRLTIGNPIHQIWRSSPGGAAKSTSFLRLLDEMAANASQE